MLLLCFHTNAPCTGFHESCCSPPNHMRSSALMDKRADALLPEISPAEAPEPLLPLMAPSPLTPFTNSTVPKLSGWFAILLSLGFLGYFQ